MIDLGEIVVHPTAERVVFEAQQNYHQRLDSMFLAASSLALVEESSEDLFAA